MGKVRNGTATLAEMNLALGNKGTALHFAAPWFQWVPAIHRKDLGESFQNPMRVNMTKLREPAGPQAIGFANAPEVQELDMSRFAR